MGAGRAAGGGIDADRLYSKIVHYYVDKKGLTTERANEIARRVVEREASRGACGAPGCGHRAGDHVRGSGTCMASGCPCPAYRGPPRRRAG